MGFTVEGDKALIKALRSLSGPAMKKAIRTGTRDGQKIIASQVKRLLPKRSGALIRSVKVRSMKRSTTRIGTTVGMGGVNFKEPFYGIFVEFGSIHNQAVHAFKEVADTFGELALNRAELTIWDKVDELWGK